MPLGNLAQVNNLAARQAAGQAASKKLPFAMQRQQQSNWCWAANAVSVGNFFYGPDKYTQCGVVNTCQGKNTCCADPAGCNQPGFLGQALEATHSFDHWEVGSTPYETIQQRINVGEPVGNRVLWTNGGGAAHFTMITGYNDDGSKITIQDSIFGESIVAYGSYPSQYHGGGSWSATYYTRKQQ